SFMMSALGIQQVSVWLDDLAPEQGAFAHALDWASRLGVPLHGLAMASFRAESPWEACAAACLQRGVPWHGSMRQGTWQPAVEQSLGSDELCVFGDALPSQVKTYLLRRSLQSPGANILACPRTWQPALRALLVHEQCDADNPFLDAATRLCEAIG